jgi:hypothetical protein
VGVSKSGFAGTTTVRVADITAIKQVPSSTLGQINPDSVQIAALLAVPAAAVLQGQDW